MKKTAYVLIDDFGHPKEKILPVIPRIFDYSEWHVCVLDGIESIVMMPNAPDLIVTFKLPNSTVLEDKPNWYESSFFTYQWMRWVREEGCGLLVIHAGFPFIPKDHPVITEGLIGHFVTHPAYCPMRFEPIVGCDHPVISGVAPFEVSSDEHFIVEGLDESMVTMLGYSYSESAGKQPSAWARTVGTGRICVLLPGHSTPENDTLYHPEMQKMMANAVRWCGKCDEGE